MKKKHRLVASHIGSDWGPHPHPRHVPWLGIKLVAFHFVGPHPTTWATPVSAKSSVLNFNFPNIYFYIADYFITHQNRLLFYDHSFIMYEAYSRWLVSKFWSNKIRCMYAWWIKIKWDLVGNLLWSHNIPYCKVTFKVLRSNQTAFQFSLLNWDKYYSWKQ